MNLTYIANLVKKLAIPISVVLIIGILVFLIFVRISGKEGELQLLRQTEIPTLNLSEDNIVFDTTKLTSPDNIPHKLTVYGVRNSETSAFDIQSITNTLKFAGNPTEINDANQGKGVIYSNEEGVLLVYPQSIIYQKNTPIASTNTQDPSLLKEKAKNFLTGISLETGQLIQASVTYEIISGEHLRGTLDKNQAQFITFHFPQTISGLPIIGPLENNKIRFDAGGNVSELVYLMQPQTQALGNYPIISLQDALKELNHGKGSLVNTEGEYEDTRIYSQIDNAKLESAYPAYYLVTEDKSIVQPLWVFKGTSSVDTTTFDVTFAVPAIDPQFLIPTPTKP